jgi:hypothetical protein
MLGLLGAAGVASIVYCLWPILSGLERVEVKQGVGWAALFLDDTLPLS